MSYSADEAKRVACSDVPLPLRAMTYNDEAGFSVHLSSCALTEYTIIGLYWTEQVALLAKPW